MRILIFFVLALMTDMSFGQYSYSYVDPCTKKVRSINIPAGQNEITVNYYGNVRIFQPNDFFNGNFGSWLNSISSENPNGPCDQVRILLTRDLNMVVAQNVVTTIMNVHAVTQAFGATNLSNLGNAVNNSEDEEKDTKSQKNKNTQTKDQSQKVESIEKSDVSSNPAQEKPVDNQNGSTRSGSNPSSEAKPENQTQDKKTETKQNSTEKPEADKTQESKSVETKSTTASSKSTDKETQTKQDGKPKDNQDTKTNESKPSQSEEQKNQPQSSESNSEPESKKVKPAPGSDEEKSKSPFGTSLSNSISNSEDSEEDEKEKKSGSKSKTGSIIGTGDIVLLRSAEDPGARDQFRITASFTRANTTNTRIWGVLGNFTTQVNLSNVTIYKAWVLPKNQWTIIGANSSMMNLDRDAFNTTTLVFSKRFRGNWKKLTTMGGLNLTTARIGESRLNNMSVVGGGFFSYNLGKKISGSVLCLGVYSPFTHFYEGRWWESGTLLVPFNSWDYKITKTFRFNMSLSGIYEMKQSVLNYQVLMGGKILL